MFPKNPVLERQEREIAELIDDSIQKERNYFYIDGHLLTNTKAQLEQRGYYITSPKFGIDAATPRTRTYIELVPGSSREDQLRYQKSLEKPAPPPKDETPQLDRRYTCPISVHLNQLYGSGLSLNWKGDRIIIHNDCDQINLLLRFDCQKNPCLLYAVLVNGHIKMDQIGKHNSVFNDWQLLQLDKLMSGDYIEFVVCETPKVEDQKLGPQLMHDLPMIHMKLK